MAALCGEEASALEVMSLHAAAALGDNNEKWPDPYLAGAEQMQRLAERAETIWHDAEQAAFAADSYRGPKSRTLPVGEMMHPHPHTPARTHTHTQDHTQLYSSYVVLVFFLLAR